MQPTDKMDPLTTPEHRAIYEAIRDGLAEGEGPHSIALHVQDALASLRQPTTEPSEYRRGVEDAAVMVETIIGRSAASPVVMAIRTLTGEPQ